MRNGDVAENANELFRVIATFDHVQLDWKRYVQLDPKFLRPAEVDHLIGDASKARKALVNGLALVASQFVQDKIDNVLDAKNLKMQISAPARG